MIQRSVVKLIKKLAHQKRAIVVIGPRQVGKTTMINEMLKAEKSILRLDGDDPFIRDQFLGVDFDTIKNIIGKHQIVFIDEGQRIAQLGLIAKMIVDRIPEVQLYITGSSALDINQEIKEPLTGRKWEIELFPITYEEWENHVGYLKSQASLDRRIVYGWYPEVINRPDVQVEVLKELTSSYLYKDILSLSGIRKPEVLERLVKLLAYQIGSEVSYNELSRSLSIDKNTVSQYVDLLEKAYIVFKLPAFASNQRKEIKKGKKIYFYDTGLRNMIIRDFSSMEERQDGGALWENFLISERVKFIKYNRRLSQLYYWRTTSQQEIDCVEVEGQNIRAYEFTLKSKKNRRIPKTFLKRYKAETMVVNKDNFRAFLELT